jgi:hypothetical protein
MSLLRKLLLIFGLAAATGASASEPKIVADALSSAEWIARALTSSGYKADFSMESLKEIDRFFDEQAPEGEPTPNGLLSESVGSRLFAIGSYVGETIRRAAEGSWEGDDADPRAEINIAVRLKSGGTFWPVQRVMKRFKNGSEDGIYAYGVVLVERQG